jgi:hypothetical protein
MDSDKSTMKPEANAQRPSLNAQRSSRKAGFYYVGFVTDASLALGCPKQKGSALTNRNPYATRRQAMREAELRKLRDITVIEEI